MLKTLANKHKSTVTKMAAKYRTRVTTPVGELRCFQAVVEREAGKKPLVAQFGGFALRHRKAAILVHQPPPIASPKGTDRPVDLGAREGFSTQAPACHHCGFGFLFELLDDYYPAPGTGFVVTDKGARILAVGRGVFELTGWNEGEWLGADLIASHGLAGFEKLAVIKKVLPHLAADAQFISRFVDEAQVAIKLQHVNIAQVFEVGRVGDEYFLALEYVEGRHLRLTLGLRRQPSSPPAGEPPRLPRPPACGG